ncbi:hypothetical protein SAMD00019534_076540 [Acytostelium subglobosum LB1]|uniref:hypothetical protein n=1 Tax=Acytostelium subglobosum LB1 TaxID=1410327 RepID=UPI000644AD3D|nr:hypothetical protein SAMD00019534_076540 [Acytostelium subglobosum LB1]GAM24479.1 hypothetical protein SAMD00019534_076540 [Acytostelium subglobosum LB1]|eukprot:XP_012752805.1 hypothetical protein SAMD00019534_076540 [Acytostelium subglobosum LB1]
MATDIVDDVVDDDNDDSTTKLNIPPPPDPPDPDECCGSGCARCVYDLYEEQLERYNLMKDKMIQAHQQQKQQRLKDKQQQEQQQQQEQENTQQVIAVDVTLSESLNDGRKVESMSITPEDVGLVQVEYVGDATEDTRQPLDGMTMGRFQSARLLTSDDSPDVCYHMTITTNDGVDIKYLPGDYINILCPQDKQDVDRLLKRLGKSGDTIIRLRVGPASATLFRHLPQHPCTLRDLFTWTLNISFVPPQFFLLQMVDHCKDESDRQKLRYLSSQAGKTLYNQTILAHNIRFPTLLTKFKSCQLPLEFILINVPAHSIRQYSISSSPLTLSNTTTTTTIDITFKLVEKQQKQADCDSTYGLCTHWMHRLYKSGESAIIPFAITHSKFHLPSDPLTTPIILISTGTGLAPFRSFLHHRKLLYHQQQQQQHGHQQNGQSSMLGKCLLFFGCRHRDWDLLYHDELLEFEREHIITKLYISYSRESDDTKDINDKKRYINSHVEECGELIYGLVTNHQGVIYVCGNSNGIGKSANESLIKIIKRYAKVGSNDEAMEILSSWTKNSQYFRDVWS